MNVMTYVTLDGVTKYVKDSAGQAMIAPEETTTTAAQAYAINDLFRYDGKLYKAIAAIAIGDTLTVNTNCAEINLDEMIIKDVQVNGVSAITDGVANITTPTGVPDGGEPYQLLGKASATDGDVGWVNGSLVAENSNGGFTLIGNAPISAAVQVVRLV